MTFEEIDERYHDAALDEDSDGWDEEEGEREDGWDDPGELGDEPDLDEDEQEDTGSA